MESIIRFRFYSGIDQAVFFLSNDREKYARFSKSTCTVQVNMWCKKIHRIFAVVCLWWDFFHSFTLNKTYDISAALCTLHVKEERQNKVRDICSLFF